MRANLMTQQNPLNFIRTHLAEFAEEPLYPSTIFEEFIERSDHIFAIESSCKVEIDKLIGHRTLVFFNQNLERSLAKVLQFFNQVEGQVGIKLNYDLFRQFIGTSFDFSKMEILTVGMDLRQHFPDSSLKIHVRLLDYPEKVETALLLSGNDSFAARWVELRAVPQIGFDFFLDGRTEVELYGELLSWQWQQPHIQDFLEQNFSPLVRQPLEISTVFQIGLSQANVEPVLYYQLPDLKELLNHFKINDTARKVHAFYQQQDAIDYMWVGVNQSELIKSRIDNIRLYYHKRFMLNNPAYY